MGPTEPECTCSDEDMCDSCFLEAVSHGAWATLGEYNWDDDEDFDWYDDVDEE